MASTKRFRAARFDRRAAAADATRGGKGRGAVGDRRVIDEAEALAEVRIIAP